MKFLDEINIKIKAGDGGNGIISFRREFRVDKGGPDGGDGGRGGSVYFVGDNGKNTLFHLKYSKHITGNNGEDGRRKNQYGAKGEDLIIPVPIGTIIYNGDKIVADIINDELYLIAKGGSGGKGNVKFKSSINTAPRISDNGEPGETFEATIVLKVLADVGFVGKPSAGKSTVLSKISNAKPKIADYEFTTLTPQLGLVYIDDNSYVVADLPGLIEGAAQGKGLGHDFLKHIERCKVIVHVIDFGSEDKDPIRDFDIINNELRGYSLNLEKRPQVVVANKSDLESFDQNLKKFKLKYKDIPIVSISALKEENIINLKRAIWQTLLTSQEIEQDIKKTETFIKFEDGIIIKKLSGDYYELSGKDVEKIYNIIPVNSYENLRRFNGKMKDIGAWNALRKKGIKEGDTVVVGSMEFVWNEEEF